MEAISKKTGQKFTGKLAALMLRIGAAIPVKGPTEELEQDLPPEKSTEEVSSEVPEQVTEVAPETTQEVTEVIPEELVEVPTAEVKEVETEVEALPIQEFVPEKPKKVVIPRKTSVKKTTEKQAKVKK